MVRAAVIGIGGYGGTLIEAIRKERDAGRCELVAAADGRLDDLGERTERLREQGVRLYTDATEMLNTERGKCDTVFIATGIGTHLYFTTLAARNGYHIHLEKPPAATVQEVDRMEKAVAEAGVICQVGFQQVWGEEIALLKRRLADRVLGPVRTIACRAGWPRTRRYYERNNWAGRLQSQSNWILDGPATNALAHQINNMLLLAGDGEWGYAQPTAVRAELYAAGPVDSHDTAAIEVETAEGPKVYFLASHCSDEQFGPVIEIDAEDATARWSMQDGTEIVHRDGSRETVKGGETPSRQAMVAGFLGAIAAGDSALIRCRMDQARHFVLALDGAHDSSRRIHRIGAEHVRREKEGTPDERTIVEGLDELLVRCAERRSLFSDARDAPDWTVATEPIDVRVYPCFPQRFEP